MDMLIIGASNFIPSCILIDLQCAIVLIRSNPTLPLPAFQSIKNMSATVLAFKKTD